MSEHSLHTYPNTRSTLQSLPIHSYIPPGSSNLGQISRTPWKRLHHLSSRFVTEVKISETPQLQCTRTAYKYTFLADFFSEHRCIRDLILPFFSVSVCACKARHHVSSPSSSISPSFKPSTVRADRYLASIRLLVRLAAFKKGGRSVGIYNEQRIILRAI
jgi:hypothetical protein